MGVCESVGFSRLPACLADRLNDGAAAIEAQRYDR